jgi:hypothetical protein
MTTIKGQSEHLEYNLTPKGRAFVPVIVALTEWGNEWDAPHGAPIEFKHDECGGEVRLQLTCTSCQSKVKDAAIVAKKTRAMALYQGELEKRARK